MGPGRPSTAEPSGGSGIRLIIELGYDTCNLGQDGWTQGCVRCRCGLYEERGDAEQAEVWCGRLTESEDNAPNE